MIDQNILSQCERHDEENMNTAQKAAENMTGQPAPKFASPEERHRIVMENAVVTIIRLLQGIKLELEEINTRNGGEDCGDE